MDDSTLKLFIFMIMLNVLFPVFAMAITDPLQVGDLYAYDIALDPYTLIEAGISFEDAASHNVTFRGGPVDFNVSGKRIRCSWKRTLITGDFFRFTSPSLIEFGIGEITGDYYKFGGREFSIVYINEQLHAGSKVHNASVINGWDPAYNWTKIDLKERGQSLFVTPIPPDWPNITYGIQETGIVTFTVGMIANEAGDINFLEFIDWYWSVLRGPEFGFPAVMSWLARILLMINMIVGILAARDILGP